MIEIASPPSPVRISIFDLDRTITRRGTWSAFLLFAAARKAPWRLLLVPGLMVVMAAHPLGLLSRKRLKSIMQAAMLGNSVKKADVTDLANQFAEQLFRNNVYPEAIAVIRNEQKAGRRVMIATASHHFYTKVLADRLEIADVIATQSVWRDERLTPAILGDNCYGAAKCSMIAQYFEEKAIKRADCHIRFFSDHHSDRPSFEWVDERVAVNPSPKLRQLATKQGWTVIDWRHGHAAPTR